MKKVLGILFIIMISAGFRARADEGMWLLPLIEKLNIGKMTELGLKLSAEDIYSLNKACLKDAIVHLRRRMHGRNRFITGTNSYKSPLRLWLHSVAQHR